MLLQDSNARCKIIQETQTSVTSTMKAKQEIILMLILQAMDQFPKYKHKAITFVSNVDVRAFVTLSQ